MPEVLLEKPACLLETADEPPILRNGDHLDQPTFHELYAAMPENCRAELVEGVVFLNFSVSADHAGNHPFVATWLSLYSFATPGTRVLVDATFILGPKDEVQPDVALIVQPEYSGRSRSEGKYLAGPPELVAEVAYSSVSYDRFSKKRSYEAAGVRDYLILNLRDQKVEWYTLRDGGVCGTGPDGRRPLPAGELPRPLVGPEGADRPRRPRRRPGPPARDRLSRACRIRRRAGGPQDSLIGPRPQPPPRSPDRAAPGPEIRRHQRRRRPTRSSPPPAGPSRAHQRGHRVLVVVSARGHTTDELIELAREISRAIRRPARWTCSSRPASRSASPSWRWRSRPSASRPSASPGRRSASSPTASTPRRASATSPPSASIQALDSGKVVIVAGFQGVDEHYNITTLGRGGSDTTAVALAAVLGADACEIYTDVDGVYTTDPRVVPEARKIDRISYDEMLELASLGAGVMHSRSIEFAKKYGVPIHVRSSFSDAPGTWIVGEGDARRLGASVTGAALAKDEARITVVGVPDRPGVVHTLFRGIGGANIVVDMIVQNLATAGTTEVSFTVAEDDLEETLPGRPARPRRAGRSAPRASRTIRRGWPRCRVVGLGMRTHTGVATTDVRGPGRRRRSTSR